MKLVLALLTAAVCAFWNHQEYGDRGGIFVAGKTGADLSLLALFVMFLRPIVAALSVSFMMNKALNQDRLGRGALWAVGAGFVSVATYRSLFVSIVLAAISIDVLSGRAVRRFEQLTQRLNAI